MTDAWRDSYDAWKTTPPEPDGDPDGFDGCADCCDVCHAPAWRDAPWCVALCDDCADALPTSDDCASCQSPASVDWLAAAKLAPAGELCRDCIAAVEDDAAPNGWRIRR